jgi:hypothetical protein
MVVAVRTPVRYATGENMRTLSTQVRLRRLIRAFSEALERLLSEPSEREMVLPVSARLLERVAEVREAWSHERTDEGQEAVYDHFVVGALRTVELAISGLAQKGADLKLLGSDFDGAALPLEVFLRGLDVQPALEVMRTATARQRIA